MSSSNGGSSGRLMVGFLARRLQVQIDLTHHTEACWFVQTKGRIVSEEGRAQRDTDKQR